MAITRRGLLLGVLGVAAAPAIVRHEWLMPLGRVLAPRTVFSLERARLLGAGLIIPEGSGGYLVPPGCVSFIELLRNREFIVTAAATIHHGRRRLA
jgi:hypothetical protein